MDEQPKDRTRYMTFCGSMNGDIRCGLYEGHYGNHKEQPGAREW